MLRGSQHICRDGNRVAADPAAGLLSDAAAGRGFAPPALRLVGLDLRVTDHVTLNWRVEALRNVDCVLRGMTNPFTSCWNSMGLQALG